MRKSAGRGCFLDIWALKSGALLLLLLVATGCSGISSERNAKLSVSDDVMNSLEISGPTPSNYDGSEVLPRPSRYSSEFVQLREGLASSRSSDNQLNVFEELFAPVGAVHPLDADDPRKEEILDIVFEQFMEGSLTATQVHLFLLPHDYNSGQGGFLGAQININAANYLNDLASLPLREMQPGNIISLVCLFRLDSCPELVERILFDFFGTDSPSAEIYEGDYFSVPFSVMKAIEFDAILKGGASMQYYLSFLDRMPNGEPRKFSALRGLDSPEVRRYLIKYIFSDVRVPSGIDYEGDLKLIGWLAGMELTKLLGNEFGFPKIQYNSGDEEVLALREWVLERYGKQGR